LQKTSFDKFPAIAICCDGSGLLRHDALVFHTTFFADGMHRKMCITDEQAFEKQESGRQVRRAAIRQAQPVQGESRATTHGGLRRRFSTAC